MEGSIIVADDDKSIRTVLAQALTRAGCRVRVTGAISTLWRWLEEGEGDVLVTDVMMPDGDALDILPVIKRKRPDLPVIIMSAQNTIATAIRAGETGAYEYFPKPFELKEVLLIVGRALKSRRNSDENKLNILGDTELKMKPSSSTLIGSSSVMQEVYRIMARLMSTDLSVLISGSSGTGKELVAQGLHDFGQRKNQPFVTVRLATLPNELIEEELFGKKQLDHSETEKIGKFEQAQGGTLFLDEVADIPLTAQLRLLGALQSGEFTKVSGDQPIKTNVRILTSTNQDLKALINEGLFREDLFYRINVVPIKLPNLNERTNDISELVFHFLNLAEKDGLSLKSISTEGIDALKAYSWPGNVRELQNFIKKMVILSRGPLITANDVLKELELSPIQAKFIPDDDFKPDRFSIIVENHLKRYFDFHGDSLPAPGLYERVIKEIELPLIALSLAATSGNQLKASDLLGINRNTLRKKIRDLDINVSRKKKMM